MKTQSDIPSDLAKIRYYIQRYSQQIQYNELLELSSKLTDLANIEFEMKKFEHLFLLNNHDFHNLIDVLIHKDLLKDNNQLIMTLKKGIYNLFYLQALKTEYILKQDIHNLIVLVRWIIEHAFYWQYNIFYQYVKGCTYRLTDKICFLGFGDYYVDIFEEDLDPVKIITTQKYRSLKDIEKLVMFLYKYWCISVLIIVANVRFLKITYQHLTDSKIILVQIRFQLLRSRESSCQFFSSQNTQQFIIKSFF